MTLLMNVPTEAQENSTQIDTQVESAISNDELTLVMDSEHEQVSPMTDQQKADKRSDAPSLYALLQKTIEDKGEYPLEKSEWSGEKELTVEGLSSMTLHSFLLKAESLGKKITYSKSLKIKISD